MAAVVMLLARTETVFAAVTRAVTISPDSNPAGRE